jgi:glycosyltransferase involved in cell wall biosynthesis
MAAGCPVVAANSGGIPDIVTDGVNGFLFDPADEQGALNATQRLLANAQERETLRHNARLEAERWSWSAATSQLHHYYKTVVGKDLMLAA